jgi:hypothetical protein
VRVDVARRGEVSVAEHPRHDAEILARLEQQSRVGVP